MNIIFWSQKHQTMCLCIGSGESFENKLESVEYWQCWSSQPCPTVKNISCLPNNLSSNISSVVLADCDSEWEQLGKKGFIQEKKRWILDRFLPFLCLTSMASLENVQKSCPLCRLYQFNSANNLVTKPISLMDIGGRAASRSQHQKLSNYLPDNAGKVYRIKVWHVNACSQNIHQWQMGGFVWLAKVILKIFSHNSWKITANFNWNHYYYKSIHSEIKIVFYSSPPAQMNKFPRLFNKTGFPFQ